MAQPKVVILLNNFNGATLKYRGKPIIDSCLETLKKTAYKNYHVVVIDDHSTDDSVRHILGKFKNVALLANKDDYGFARSINGGIMYATRRYRPDYLLLLSNDIMVTDKNWINSMVDVAESDESIGLVSCKLKYPNGRVNNVGFKVTYTVYDIAKNEEDNGQYDTVTERDALVTDVLLIKKETIKKVGLFDGKFYLGHDDIDYGLRTNDAGLKVIYDGNASVVHLGSFTLTRKRTSDESMRWFYYLQRNVAYFALKHLSLPYRILAFLKALSTGVVTMEGESGRKGISNIRFKDRPLLRLRTALGAYSDAYALYGGRAGQPDYTKDQFKVVRGR